ncbi:LysR substrate-binding domain-containing protein [uncultured Pseudacidovorax sp.]|uniref:LysR substrate-binding domain-containing protein n=1 Tax=uncultured Pseudacidovorax sp. TaxID=679313 RepID=UPI0025F705A2|nr:LysR substrate-binding domain-containing protein [uncultured Pseudacidovorax sp.]
MPPSPHDIADDLTVLALVVDAGGYSAASHRSGIPVSRLSRRIAALERKLGVSLIVRSSRTFRVTDIGQRMHQHGVRILSEAQRAMSQAKDSLSEPSGALRISCPVMLNTMVVGPLATDFALRHPQVSITVDSTDGRATAFAEPADLQIRPTSTPLRDSSLVVRRLAVVPYVLAAAPALCETLPGTTSPAELQQCPGIGWSFRAQPSRWPLHHPQLGSMTLELTPRLVSDSLIQIRAAAVAGLGIAQLPASLCEAEVKAGRLQVIAPGWAPANVELYALYPSRRDLTVAGRLFLDELCLAMARIDSPH